MFKRVKKPYTSSKAKKIQKTHKISSRQKKKNKQQKKTFTKSKGFRVPSSFAISRNPVVGKTLFEKIRLKPLQDASQNALSLDVTIIPKTYLQRVENLLEQIKRNYSDEEFSFTPRGELIVNNEIIPNTNITQLLLQQFRKSVVKPNGYELFKTFVKDINWSHYK